MLQIYDGEEIINNTDTIFTKLHDLSATFDHSFMLKLQSLQGHITEQLAYCDHNQSFLTRRFYQPLLLNLQDAVGHLDRESQHRFASSISLGMPNDAELEKRYPFHEQEREVTLIIPLINSGPGMAVDVTIDVVTDCDALSFNGHTTKMGDIDPGRFSFALPALVVESCERVRLQLEICWGSVASPARFREDFCVVARAQALVANWDLLAESDPYSTEVAIGSEFVGRQEKVSKLVGRLTKGRMESSYVTGQKRVGKSSLALAVQSKLSQAGNQSEYKVKYAEWGDYSHSNPERSLSNLGELLGDFLNHDLPGDFKKQELRFDGSLAPITKLLSILESVRPESRYVFILDEFDSIHQELYRFGPLADTLFSNMRSISAKRNAAFLLIGGEKMPFIIAAQGDELNKFVREELSYFSRSDEWDDFVRLVTLPASGFLNWHLSALNAVFNYTNGHPYFTKLLCKQVYARAVRERDADITEAEIERAYDGVISSLDPNSFAHIWKDGIKGTREDEEITGLRRCRLLVAVARALRSKLPITLEAVDANKQGVDLTKEQIVPLLNEFCRRGFMSEDTEGYHVQLPLFRDWLAQAGLNLLIADTLGDELAAVQTAAERRAFVTAEEIRDLVDRWSTYRGQKTSAEHVRAWLDQVPGYQDQRLLFRILESIRFFSEQEIQEKLRAAHTSLSLRIPEFIRRSVKGKKTDLRRDLIITYIDGPGKSGAEYASMYAEENFISNACIKEMSNFSDALLEHEQQTYSTVNGVVIVDDIIASGNSFRSNISRFVDAHRDLFIARSMPLIVVCLTGVADGLSRARAVCEGFDGLDVVFRVCEALSTKHVAFQECPGVWESEADFYRARELCNELGLRTARSHPLGYQDQGLLVVFPRTVPNNTLPILHSNSTREKPWRALFTRPFN